MGREKEGREVEGECIRNVGKGRGLKIRIKEYPLIDHFS